MRGKRVQPGGLEYRAELVTPGEERALIELIEGCGLAQFVMNGRMVKRLVRGYGRKYDWETGALSEGEPLPAELGPLRRRAELFAGLPEGAIVQALLQKYPVGAAISWHKDKQVYGTIVGISLGAPCIMQFQRGTGEARKVYERVLNPRSGYVLAGPVRHDWEHHIPTLKAPRYSITFRTVARVP